MDNFKFIEFFKTLRNENPGKGKPIILLKYKPYNKNEIEMEYSIDYIQSQIDDCNCGLLITNGECSFGNNIFSTIFLLNNLKYPYAFVETNTCDLNYLSDNTSQKTNQDVQIIYSPKISNKNNFIKAYKNLGIIQLDHRIKIKIVICDETFEYNEKYLNYLCDLKLNDRVYIISDDINKNKISNFTPEILELVK